MLIVEKNSLLISDDRFNNLIFEENNHRIYYLSGCNNKQILFLYKCSDFNFNFKEPKIIVTNYKTLYNYDIGGYPIMLNKIKNNLYSLSYGSFSNIGKEDDINNDYGKQLRSNSIFIKNALKHLFNLFPNIEIFDYIADFQEENWYKIENTKADFDRRSAFFRKNKFLIITHPIQYNIEKTKYYKTILRLINKRSMDSFIYINKNIFVDK